MRQLRFVLLLVFFYGLSTVAGTQTAPLQPVTIDEIFHDDRLLGLPPQGMLWSPDGARLSYISDDGDLMQVEGATGVTKVLVSRDKMKNLNGVGDEADRERYHLASYLWAPDGRHLLFESAGELWLFDLKSGTGVEAGSVGPGIGGDPKFSPDGKSLSYIRDHSLYVNRLQDDLPGAKVTESKGETKPNSETMLNGEVDWVYEEELGVRSNYFWSPDSKHVAYLQMNEERVPEYPIEDWIPVHARVERQRYPQPGDPNPEVHLGVVSANGGKTKWIDLPIANGDDYIPRFGWLDNKTLWIETLTRSHQKLTLFFASLSEQGLRPVLTVSDDKFLDESYDMEVLGSSILLTGWRDGHNHIYLYSFDPANPLGSDAKLVRQLTSGDWEVSAIRAVDEKTQTVYYLSNEGDPRQQQLWAVKMDGTGKRRVSTSEGWHDPLFSPNAKFFADTISSAMTPPIVNLCRGESDCTNVWKAPETGAALAAPTPLQLKAADGTTALYGTLQLPPDKTAPASVPLVVNPYGGPGEPTVTDQWDAHKLLFDQVLAEHGFAVLHVDNRGMGGRGRDFAQAAYHNFGAVQFSDQMAAVDQVLAKYPQLDAKRLGWWGWSWGGTFTLYAMTHSDRFCAGVSVAPVTNWRDYDSIYTERYLGEPADNADPYRDASVVYSAANLKGRLLLVHGTGDDNVHLENSIQFVQALVGAEIPYDLQLYPDRKHGIDGAEARIHLFRRILRHFELYLMNPPAGDGE